MLQLLVYCGLRRTVLSKLHRQDIIKSELIKNGSIEIKYSVRARNAKGSKTRVISVKDSVGKSLYDYAQSLDTVHLFPGKKPGEPLGSQSCANRIKTIAKKIGKPEISPHWFRHFMATNSLYNGANLVDVSKALGHSSVQVN